MNVWFYLLLAVIAYGGSLCIIGIAFWYGSEKIVSGYSKGSADPLKEGFSVFVIGVIVLLTLMLAWGWIKPEQPIGPQPTVTATHVPN